MTRSVSVPWSTAPSALVPDTSRRLAHADNGGENSRALAGMLLAAAMAALLVVADQVIDTWTDGHLLAGWVALWTLAFAALAFLASPLRLLAANVAALIVRQLQRAQVQRAEARMWEYASRDPRTLADIRLLRTRASDGL